MPIRLIWDNWQKFNGEQKNPGDSTDFVLPTMTAPAGGYLNGTLSDYFGIPTEVASLVHTSLWHRAYNLIWNEWFRDQNLQNSVVVDVDDGPDAPTDYVLLRRGKRHDYFTSCLPWPQKGPAVELPLGTQAPIQGLYYANGTGGSTVNTVFVGTDDVQNQRTGASYVTNNVASESGTPATTNYLTGVGGFDTIYADLSTATASTINAIRLAFQIQKLYERDARGGTRYIELIRSHFGVVSPDARLQRPEYLGGGRTPVNIHPVAQTANTPVSGTPQGNLSAFGTVALSGHGFTKSFTEHCVLIGLVSVQADLTYQQGLNRMFSRSTRFDFYWPALSHIGEQSVLTKEIYATGVPAQDDVVFGYQERYAEYRYKPSVITGQFRSNYATSLDLWHLAQDFGAAPVLNASFIEDNPPIDRVIAVPSEPHFLFDAYFGLKCARPMPVYSVPGLIDHF